MITERDYDNIIYTAKAEPRVKQKAWPRAKPRDVPKAEPRERQMLQEP